MPRVAPELRSPAASSVSIPGMLSVREVARLGVCTSTVYKLCNEGKLAHFVSRTRSRYSPVQWRRWAVALAVVRRRAILEARG